MNKLDDAEHWRARAEEAYAIADGKTDLRAKRIMDGIAASYKNLADLAEKRAQQAAKTASKPRKSTEKRGPPKPAS